MKAIAVFLCVSLGSFASVLAAGSSGSCKNVTIPDVNNLKKCLRQASSNCNPSQAPIDAIKPIVTCVYDALKEQNKAADVVVTYGDIIYALVNATTNPNSAALAKDFKNSVDQTTPGTVKLTKCTKGTFPVPLPSKAVGKCTSDFGTDCQKSTTSLVSPLVKFVLCLVKNALPGASQDKIVALLCAIIDDTDVSSLGGSYLAAALNDIDSVLCSGTGQG